MRFNKWYQITKEESYRGFLKELRDESESHGGVCGEWKK
jgi:hypothetical protein